MKWHHQSLVDFTIYDDSHYKLCHFIGTGTAILAGAGIQGATSLAGGKKGASAARDAANIQAQTAREALALQSMIFEKTQANIKPFLDFGTGQLPVLAGRMDELTAPYPDWKPDLASLQQTPGYQFTLDQGLKRVQAEAAARGQGRGGPSLQGAIQYAEGLAGTRYDTEFQHYLALRTQDLASKGQEYNMLTGAVGIGERAAATGAGVASNYASQAGQTLGQLGAAQASGIVGSANAWGNALTGVGNAAGNAASLSTALALTGQGGAGGSNSAGLGYAGQPDVYGPTGPVPY